MKFATALLALATAAMASPTGLAPRGDHDSDKYGKIQHHKSGHGRWHGGKRHCENWVPVDASLVVIEVDIEVCLNVEVDIPGLASVEVEAHVDVEVDIAVLRERYPTLSHLYCDPGHHSKKGKKIHEDKCWEHEFDQDKYHKYY